MGLDPRALVGAVFFGVMIMVGSEVYGAVLAGRFGIGAELKESYFKQAVRNLETIQHKQEQPALFQ